MLKEDKMLTTVRFKATLLSFNAVVKSLAYVNTL